MTILTVRSSTMLDINTRFVAAGKQAAAGVAVVEAEPSVEFASYEDMHRILAPLRLTIVKTLAGAGPISIREIARRADRDVQADIAT